MGYLARVDLNLERTRNINELPLGTLFKPENNYYFRIKNPDGSPIFVQPANGTLANQTRNLRIYNPGLQSYNAALFKEFRVTERHYVQFRMEMFNFPNHPYWSGLVTNPTATSFGKVTSHAQSMRRQTSLGVLQCVRYARLT